MLVGGPNDASTPVRGTVKAEPVAGGATIEVSAHDDGRFEIRLPFGNYKVTGTSPLFGSGAYECNVVPPPPVTVGDKTTTAVTVECVME